MLGGSAAAERMVMEKYFTGGKNMRRELIFILFFSLPYKKYQKQGQKLSHKSWWSFSLNPSLCQLMRIALTKFLHQGKEGTLYHEASKRWKSVWLQFENVSQNDYLHFAEWIWIESALDWMTLLWKDWMAWLWIGLLAWKDYTQLENG